MRWLIVLLVALGLAGLFAWQNRLDLLLWAAPRVADLRDPIGPNRPIPWSEGPTAPAAEPADRPPNIVLILADDLGFNDVSYFNGGAADGSILTPNIDAIAHQGVAFTNGYAANAICAPSRASIMSGRYSTRFGFEFTPFPRIGVLIGEWMAASDPSPLRRIVHGDRMADLGEMDSLGMPADEITIAEVLKAAGYYTAHIGKWHLGGVSGLRPEDQGFDDSLYMAGLLYRPKNAPDVVNAPLEFDFIDRMVWASARYAAEFNGSDPFEPDGYLTDYYTDQAVRVIEANRHRPFLLYLAHWGVHNPLQAKREDYDALAHIDDHALRVYAAMITALDRGVGRVLEALEANGLSENTLVLFTSDNGGAGYLGLRNVNRPYRGWKLTHFEGGLHVPFFARWPAQIAPGSTYAPPVSHLDLFATVAAAAGAPLPADRRIDGVDLLPYVTGQAEGAPHETLFWRQGYQQAVLHDGWKLITTERPPTDRLFHLATDPTEQHDVADRNPERVAQLKALLAAHNAEQAEPLWPSVVETPVLIDKTSAEAYEEGDEFAYWPN
ncbi:MAG TPA: sulfatase-like hydrolase/transferase [Pseudomonadales bacterium]